MYVRQLILFFPDVDEISWIQKCVIATGAQQPSPMRPQPESTEKEYLDMLRNSQSEIAKATKIIVVGGGAVGCEVAGVSSQLSSVSGRSADIH